MSDFLDTYLVYFHLSFKQIFEAELKVVVSEDNILDAVSTANDLVSGVFSSDFNVKVVRVVLDDDLDF